MFQMTRIYFFIAMLWIIVPTAKLMGQQPSPFDRFVPLIGHWEGIGKSEDHNSKVVSDFSFAINGRYVKVSHDVRFDPSEKTPEGEHHLDTGFISYDNNRHVFVLRQFHGEGFVNQYILVDTESDDSTWTFETENIENFTPNGKAKWVIYKRSEDQIETYFYLSTTGGDYILYSKNTLTKV